MKFIISLGGSLIVPNEVDIKFLKELKALLTKSRHEFVLVCGGGKTARNYINAAKEFKMSKTNMDLIGMKATELNATLVAKILGCKAANNLREIRTNKDKFITGYGYFPGMTTDADSVMAAGLIKADVVINLSNVKGVYNKDPVKHKDAKMYKKMNYDELIMLAEKEVLGLGSNFIFDLKACRLAKKEGIKLIFIKGLGNLRKVINGKRFIGTVIE